MLPWLFIHFPCLQLDSLVTDSAHEGRSIGDYPIAIIDAKHNVVCQLNNTASKEGIKSGMGMATAVSLCGDLSIIEYNRALEQNRLNELAQWLYQVIADIVLFEPNGLALKVTNMLSLYGDLEHYLAQITPILTQQKVTYKAAFGQTVIAAKLLAQYGPDDLCVDQNRLKLQLDQLPITALELADKSIEQMHRLGITRVQQLRQVSSKELGRRFGLAVLNYLSLIDGSGHLSLTPYEPPEHYSSHLELFHEIEQSQVLLFPLKRMVTQMSNFLSCRDWVVSNITITLHHRDKEHHPQLQLEIGSATGEYRVEPWMTLITLQLERTELAAAVLGITLQTGEPIAKHSTSGNLLSDNQTKMSPQQLISLLQAKVGQKHIVGIDLFADHRPEKAFDYGHPLKHSDSTNSLKLRNCRPLLLLPEAQPLAEKCTILHGPERIRTAWWSLEPVYRDYFIAQDSRGILCWIYNEPCGNWYLQGYFS